MRLTLALCLSAVLGISACSSIQDTVVTPAKTSVPVELAANVVDKAKGVGVDTVVTAKATHGELTAATLYAGTDPAKNVVKGRVTGAGWVASQLLEPGQTYHLEVKGRGEDGKSSAMTRTFSTEQLTLAQQTYPSVAPLEGETVGVGMPVIVTFDLPVKNRALYERKMRVESTPAVEGSWSWLSDREVHFRPKTYWPAGTKVKIVLSVNGLPAGDGIYGQQDQVVSFDIGRSVVSTVDVAARQLIVSINGKVARKIPVTTGDNSHRSREGTKVIMEKFSSIDMDAATTGVDSEDPGYYNIKDVRWAMRLTNSGEFLHAAPWSVGSQGVANVSHGCTGMSTANAQWFFSQSKRGDVVRFVNSPRQLEQGNGWTDWDLTYTAFAQRSAL
ncbi:MAG: L,D-transpeptidase family protein [Kineosporiaceae bacterium]|nr:L,D-transpeptidase family protein [Aeromicrobium sp.]